MYPSESVFSAKSTGSHPDHMISFSLVLTSQKDSQNDFIFGTMLPRSSDSVFTFKLQLSQYPNLLACLKNKNADIGSICWLILHLCHFTKQNSSMCPCWHKFEPAELHLDLVKVHNLFYLVEIWADVYCQGPDCGCFL